MAVNNVAKIEPYSGRGIVSQQNLSNRRAANVSLVKNNLEPLQPLYTCAEVTQSIGLSTGAWLPRGAYLVMGDGIFGQCAT